MPRRGAERRPGSLESRSFPGSNGRVEASLALTGRAPEGSWSLRSRGSGPLRDSGHRGGKACAATDPPGAGRRATADVLQGCGGQNQDPGRGGHGEGLSDKQSGPTMTWAEGSVTVMFDWLK